MKKHAYLITSISIFAIFLIFTILVKTVDVQMIYNNTYLGFYDLNFKFGNLVVNFGKYKSSRLFSDIILYIALGYSAILAILGVINLIQVKSFKKVNIRYYILLGAYVSIAILYLIFKLARVNFSPDSSVGNLKSSYPSTHVFVGITLFLLNTYTALRLLNPEKKWVIYLTNISTVVICLLMLFTRLLSLKLWLTDIIAGLILSSFIYLLFIYFSHLFVPANTSEETPNE